MGDKEVNLKVVGTLDQTIQSQFKDVDEDVVFDIDMAQLLGSRMEADTNCDFDVSARVHKEIQSLKERELARLEEMMGIAVQRRDYKEAKRIKARLAHVASLEL